MSPLDREAELVRRCQGDMELVGLVRALLDQDAAKTILGGSVQGTSSADQSVRVGSLGQQPGEQRFEGPTSAGMYRRRIGAYTILDLLGEGGMGAVYLAEQERPRRMVALKLVRPGLVTPAMLRRFEHESEMLARLQHPGIAQIYEAGAAEFEHGQQPFFAMEYVRGTALGDFADDYKLGVNQRIELFIRICDAVHHAHQKGVIHRDLKPGNILVQLPDGAATAQSLALAQPKILDFGIARTTDPGSQRTMQTEVGQLIGTVPYMSPEQISGEANAIDIRSDVYTLGVILYELLAGRLPHAVSDKTIPEAVRTITQDDPQPISVMNSSFRGDIQTIVSKALERDRERRYQSASDLAADLGRYLRNEPILAQPPSRTYLFRKFARRNRAAVIGAVLVLLALVGGIVGTTAQAVRAERARAAAKEEADVAKAANEFLTGMLAAANPDQNNERELTVREMVDRAAELLERNEASRATSPRVAMSLHFTLSGTYRALGQAEKALKQAEQAVALATQLHGEDHPETISARRTLSMALGELARYDEAESIARDCVVKLEALLGPKDPEVSRARGEHGRVLLEKGDVKEAEVVLRQAVDELSKAFGTRHTDTLTAIDHLAITAQRLGRLQESELLEREGLRIREEVFGLESTVTAFSLNNIANVVQRQGRNQEAADLLQRALDIRRKRLDPQHPSILVSMTNLAVALVGLGRLNEAEKLLHEGVEMQVARLGEEHPKTMSAMGNLAYVLEEQNKLEEAERLHERVVALRRKTGLLDQESWGNLNNYAMLLQRVGKPGQAEKLYRELLPLCEAKLPADHYVVAIFRNNFGDCLTDAQKFEEAEAALRASHVVLERFFKAEHPRTKKSAARLQRLYSAWGRPAPADVSGGSSYSTEQPK